VSFPNIPDINPSIDINREDVINLLLASVGLEELSLAHILNAEAEKLQWVLGTLSSSSNANLTEENLLAINNSVNKTLKTVVKNEMLLQFKLENIMDISDETFSPSINIKKYVSVDNGITYYDANVPPVPTLIYPTNPMFKLVITNTGNVTLTGVSVTDSVLGPISIGSILSPGASFEEILTGRFKKGQQSNTVTVTGSYKGQIVTDSDVANYFGTGCLDI